MNHIIVNIKNSVGGVNGRLDTAGEKLVSWKIDWKKLSRVSYSLLNRILKSTVKRHRRQTKSCTYLIGVPKNIKQKRNNTQ